MGKCSCCSKELLPGEKYVILENGVHLCESCIEIVEKSAQLMRRQNFIQKEKILKPSELKEIWDQYVVGQQEAKKTLAVAVYNHYKRVAMGDFAIKKSNVLMIGPTGSGKTYLVEIMAKAMHIPLVCVDATTLTEAGYIGDDVEIILEKLLDVCEGDVERAQRGIVFIDEIDKLSSTHSSTEKKVGGKGVQQALLKLLEGSMVDVPYADRGGFGDSKKVRLQVDTSQILFICGGAFPDLENIIKQRISKKSRMGFCEKSAGYMDCPKQDILLSTEKEDLEAFGMIPEFLGRLPIIVSLEELTVETLKQILSEPKDCLVEQYKKLLQYDGVHLEFEPDALEEIAKRAYNEKTGARSLRAIMEKTLRDIMFEAPDQECGERVLITKELVANI